MAEWSAEGQDTVGEILLEGRRYTEENGYKSIAVSQDEAENRGRPYA